METEKKKKPWKCEIQRKSVKDIKQLWRNGLLFRWERISILFFFFWSIYDNTHLLQEFICQRRVRFSGRSCVSFLSSGMRSIPGNAFCAPTIPTEVLHLGDEGTGDCIDVGRPRAEQLVYPFCQLGGIGIVGKGGRCDAGGI